MKSSEKKRKPRANVVENGTSGKRRDSFKSCSRSPREIDYLKYISVKGDLTLQEMHLQSIPAILTDSESLGIGQQIINLNLSKNELRDIPVCFYFSLTHLKTLNLSLNNMTIIHKDIKNLSKLEHIDFSHNSIHFLPPSISHLSHLSSLSLAHNKLFCLPSSIQQLTSLKTLLLNNNQIRYLCVEIGSLTALRILHVHNNRFTSFPCSIHNLKQMEELSLDWFRYTNPPLPKILNTSVGLGIIKSLRDLCLLLLSSGMRECGMTTLVQNYSENEFDVNAMDSRNRNRSVLHVAAQEDDLGVLEALLLLQPDLNLLDKENWSPLGLALREDNVEIASAFIDNKCDVNIGGGIFGSPLHMAVLKLEVWLVKKIIQNNGKVNIMDDDGNTPLHILLSIFSKNSFKAGIIGEALLLAGAKPNFKNKDKWTCVHIAARRGQYEGIEWILEQNNLLKKRCMETFDPNLLGGIEKWSALHLAGHSGHYKIVQHLLSAGADLFIRNNDHRTPRQTSKGNLALNKLFRKAETNAALKQIHLLSHVHDDKETPVERISQFEIGGCDILKEEETLDLVIDNELTKKNKCGYSYTFKETLLEVEKIKQRKKELINKIKIDRRSPKLTLDIDLIEKDLRFESPILTLSKHFQNVDKMAEEGLGRSSSAQTHQKKEFVFGNKNINIYYLKDRIFDEKSRLFEKYEALYSILYIYFDQRNNSTILTVFKNILDNLSLVSDRLLKIQIIQLMGQVNHPSLLPHLENIRKDNLNDKVIRKELSEVVEMINSENSRRKQMILKEKKSHIVEKGVVQRKEHKENNERIKIKSTDFGKTMPLSKLNVIQGTQLSKTSKYFDEIRNNEHGILGDTRVRSRTHETEGEFFPPENNGEEIFSIYDWKNIQALDTLAKQYQSLQN